MFADSSRFFPWVSSFIEVQSIFVSALSFSNIILWIYLYYLSSVIPLAGRLFRILAVVSSNLFVVPKRIGQSKSEREYQNSVFLSSNYQPKVFLISELLSDREISSVTLWHCLVLCLTLNLVINVVYVKHFHGPIGGCRAISFCLILILSKREKSQWSEVDCSLKDIVI